MNWSCFTFNEFLFIATMGNFQCQWNQYSEKCNWTMKCILCSLFFFKLHFNNQYCAIDHTFFVYFFFYKIVFKRKYVIYRNQKKRYFFNSVVCIHGGRLKEFKFFYHYYERAITSTCNYHHNRFLEGKNRFQHILSWNQ